jgi:ABC-type glycerol-3-phosphate transport system permease component
MNGLQIHMNGLQILLIALAGVFFLLLPISRGAAWKYARITALLIVATLMLMPFAWLICAAFKSTDALNEFTFLPPPSKFNTTNLNLDNFRALLKPQPTLSGPVTFWRYVTNSLFLSSTMTVVSLFFSSLGGYALAKYRFRGRNFFMI